jgi:hypothetical protein
LHWTWAARVALPVRASTTTAALRTRRADAAWTSAAPRCARRSARFVVAERRTLRRAVRPPIRAARIATPHGVDVSAATVRHRPARSSVAVAGARCSCAVPRRRAPSSGGGPATLLLLLAYGHLSRRRGPARPSLASLHCSSASSSCRRLSRSARAIPRAARA